MATRKEAASAAGKRVKEDGRKTRSSRDTTLVEHVRTKILEDIIQGRMEPGSVIQLASLAEQYNVSRTPVREALSILERQGLVHAIAYKGYLVHTIDPGDVNDVFFMRRLLEGAGVERATPLISDEQLARMRELHPPLSEHMTLAYDDYSHDFHRTIITAVGSQRLTAAFESVYNDVRRLQYAGIGSPRPDLIYREHMEILDALEARDQQRARKVMEDHIDQIRARALEHWLRGGGA